MTFDDLQDQISFPPTPLPLPLSLEDRSIAAFKRRLESVGPDSRALLVARLDSLAEESLPLHQLSWLAEEGP